MKYGTFSTKTLSHGFSGLIPWNQPTTNLQGTHIIYYFSTYSQRLSLRVALNAAIEQNALELI